jgi:hypothetical protein
MPQPRKNQISLIDTPYYHCVSRCVRRLFCVAKNYRGQNKVKLTLTPPASCGVHNKWT